MSLGVKAAMCVRLTTYHHIVPMSRNLGALTLLDPSGPAWPVMSVLYLFIYAIMRLTTYHHIVPMSRNLGASTLLDPSGPAWPVMGVLSKISSIMSARPHGTSRLPLSGFHYI
jgi:hypothetical protein